MNRNYTKMIAFILMLALIGGFIPVPGVTDSNTVNVYATGPATTPAGIAAGDGSSVSPYLITSVEDLMWVSSQSAINNVNFSGKYFRQTSDLDLSGIDWVPIGNATTQFRGIYDGYGHTISHINVSGNYRDAGLFGWLESSAISNLGLLQANIRSSDTNSRSGALAGYSSGTIIDNCFTTGTVSAISTSTGYAIGGLVGELNGQEVAHSYSVCAVVSDSNTGVRVGGIAGLISSNSTLKSSYYGGSVLSGGQWKGILAADNSSSTITNTLYTVISGWSPVQAGSVTTMGPTVTQVAVSILTTPSTYSLDTYFGATNKWNFTTIWAIDANVNGGFPFLRAQNGYTITYQPGTQGTFNVTTTSALYGAATPTAPAITGNSGYHFIGWNTTPAATVTGSITYIAQWAQNQDQPTPAGLTAVSPSMSGGTDGKITGTTDEMEYKLSSATTFSSISATEITGLAPGTYQVRYRAKSGFNAGAILNVIVPEFVTVSGPAPMIPSGGNLQYSLMFETNGGSLIFPLRTAMGTSAIKPSTPVRAGYKFAGWFEDATFTTAFDFASGISGNTWIFAKWIPAVEPRITLRFNIGNTNSYLKEGTSLEQLKVMDTSPIISGERTLLPIRFVIEPLGGTIDWSQNDNKVTIKQGTTTIELWIGNNTAKVNGVAALIDPANPAVMPVNVYPGRAMLPLRFISETLGCTVEWDQLTRGITVTQ